MCIGICCELVKKKLLFIDLIQNEALVLLSKGQVIQLLQCILGGGMALTIAAINYQVKIKNK